MAGLTTLHRYESGQRGFVTFLQISTNRYDTTDFRQNSLQLFTRSCVPEENWMFVADVLQGLGAGVFTRKAHDVDSSRGKPARRIVKNITIRAAKVRDAVDRLFARRLIPAELRSDVEDRIRELETCQTLHSKLDNDISHVTQAQKDMIQSFVGDSLEVLNKKMEPWQIRSALELSKEIMRNSLCSDKEDGVFDRIISIGRLYVLAGESFRSDLSTPVLDERWSPNERRDVLGALRILGRVLSGKAMFEDALMQMGTSLPSLEVQKKVIMELIP